MININKSVINQIVQKFPEVKGVYVIGSFIRNQQRKDSDFDLVVIVDKVPLERLRNIFNEFNSQLKIENLDLRIVIPEETDPLFLFEIVKGKPLYFRSEKARVEFETRVLKLYYDTQHLRNIYNFYLKERLSKGFYGK